MSVRGVDASYYTTANLERATAFYTELLGAKPTIAVPERLSEWTLSDDTAFGVYFMPEYKGSASGSVMFAVADVEAAMRDAKARGVKFDDDEITEGPVCKMCFGRDPDNNQFILHQRLG